MLGIGQPEISFCKGKLYCLKDTCKMLLSNSTLDGSFYTRFVNGMVYYGVSFSSPSVGGNMYLNFFITSTIALVAYPALAWGCNRYVT